MNKHEQQHQEGEIEGILWKNEKGEWVANFGEPTFDLKGEQKGRYMKVRVDYCPWCGRRLD